MYFNKRLKHAMNLRNIKQVDLVRKTGISKSSISQYVSGEYIPKQDKIFSLAKALDVDPSWLMGKDVPMEGAEYKKGKAKPKITPVVGTIAAGTPILAQQNIEEYFTIDANIKTDFALKVKGDSMINVGIYEGDIVFIRQQPDLENGEIGAVLINDEATLKRVYKQNSSITLVAENSKYPPKTFTNGDIRVLGKLSAVLHRIE